MSGDTAAFDIEAGIEASLRAGRHRTALLLARRAWVEAPPADRPRLRLLEGRALAADGRPNEGLAVLDDAWLLSLEANAPLDPPARDLAYGECLLAAGDLDAAVEHLHRAWRAEAARGDARRAADAAHRCATALIDTDRVDLGRRAAEAAAAVFVNMGHTRDAARCQMTIARAHLHTQDLAGARTAADAARSMFQRVHATDDAADAMRVLARVAMANGAISDAVAHLESALFTYGPDGALAQTSSTRQELAEALVELGLNLGDENVIASALPWFSAAFDGFVRVNDTRQAASTARREAWTLRLLGRSVDARHRLDETADALRRALG